MKLSLRMVLVAVVAGILALTGSAARADVCGDVNGNGKVDVGDASLALGAALNLRQLTPAQFARADIGGTGKITVADVTRILHAALGLADLSAGCNSQTGATVSTIVGSSVVFADGPAQSARFYGPEQLAVDSAGNVYVADRLNNRIRKVAPDGTVSTIAGSDPGFADGPGLTTARFRGPNGIAVDANGVLYVSDAGNERIRKITPDGMVSTIAGNPPLGTDGTAFGDFLDGPALQAEFSVPAGLAVDSKGDLFIADVFNNRIRELTPNGVVSTLAGNALPSVPGLPDGPPGIGSMITPNGVAILNATTLVVADTGDMEIRTIDIPTGTLKTLSGNPMLDMNNFPIGGFQDGDPTKAQFNSPTSAAVGPDGTVYVADTGNNRIRVVDPMGNATTFAGNDTPASQDGKGTVATFNSPDGIATDAQGNVYVADTGGDVIRKIAPDGTVKTLAGQADEGYQDGPAGQALLLLPEAVAVGPDGSVYIADSGNNRIRKMDPTGNVTTVAGTGTAGFADGPALTAEFDDPTDVALDASGKIYVADRANQRIRVIDTMGIVSTLAGNPSADAMGNPMGDFANGPTTAAKFNRPRGLAVAPDGTVYVADSFNHRIRRIGTDGQVTTVSGSDTQGFQNGAASTALFSYPQKIALDAQGNIYVSDLGNDLIRKISTDGIVTTVAGAPQIDQDGFIVRDFRDGPALDARFNLPEGLQVDKSGNIYLADRGNNRIRKIGTDGNVTTIAGGQDIGLKDGAGTSARFNNPIGLALDNNGNLIVADFLNSRIRRISLNGQ